MVFVARNSLPATQNKQNCIFMYYDKHMHLMYVIISPTTDILTDV